MTGSTRKTSDIWEVYSVYTHKVVERTNNIKEFCDKQKGLSSNAHIQIYKTNTPRKDDPKKALLPTYKGFFIRKEGEKGLPFPELKYMDPTSYRVCQYKDADNLVVLGEMPVEEFDAFADKQGWSKKDRNQILSTCKTKRDGTVKLPIYQNTFITPIGENVREIKKPKYVAPKEHNRGSGKVYHVFNKNLELVEITRDLVGFAEKANAEYAKENPNDPNPLFKYHKPLYKTNTPHLHDPEKPQMEFYKGYCIRLESDLEKGTAMPLPNPFKGSKTAYNAHLDMVVWSTSDRKENGVRSFYIPHYSDKIGKESIKSKAELYEKARNFSQNQKVTEGLNAVFISDIINNDDILELLAEEEVLLPPEVFKKLESK